MQPTRKYRYALVELYTELLQDDYDDVGDAIQAAILASPQARSEAVRQVFDELDRVACERVLFPGWTLVGSTLPQWVMDRTDGRTVIIEMLPPRAQGNGKRNPKGGKAQVVGRWRAFVVRDRRVLVGPVFQLFYSGSQVGEPGNPSPAATRLTAQLTGQADPDRRWEDPAFPEAALFMCGEVNVIYAPRTQGQNMPVVQGFPSFDLIMNPAHKPNKLDAMRRKRRHLSQMRPNAVLFMTSNTHGSWRKGGKQQNRRTTAAEAYCNGRAMTAVRTIPVGPHRILLFE